MQIKTINEKFIPKGKYDTTGGVPFPLNRLDFVPMKDERNILNRDSRQCSDKTTEKGLPISINEMT